MPLTPDQIANLTAAAEANGLNPGEVLSRAEALTSGQTPAGLGGQSGANQNGPKLYMYLLPFVTVREVRQTFLGLTDSFPGDDEIASDWGTDHPLVGAKAEPVGGQTETAQDSMDDDDDSTAVTDAVGDVIRHDEDGWHVYAGDRHVGGPFGSKARASRWHRKYSAAHRPR